MGWRTASIRRKSELPKVTVLACIPLSCLSAGCSSMTNYYIYLQWEDSLNEKYPHIVYEEHCEAHDTEHCDPKLKEDDDSDKLEGWYLH